MLRLGRKKDTSMFFFFGNFWLLYRLRRQNGKVPKLVMCKEKLDNLYINYAILLLYGELFLYYANYLADLDTI